MKTSFFWTLTLGILLSISQISFSQSYRTNTADHIGWYNAYATFKLNGKFGVHTEYQWRRTEFGKNWQQSLTRTGINYNFKPNVLFRLGYAFVETYAYGEIPLNSFGKNFSEHRIYQMVQLNQTEGKLLLQHRFMLEQRFVGRYSNATLEHEDEFVYTNRLRYLLRLQRPLKGNVIAAKVPYAAIYDEVFIGFGENVKENVFDQNRIGALLGYVLNPKIRFELGYLNQIVQLGREVDGKNVFQHNHGIIFNTLINLDVSKPKKESN